MTIYNFAEGSQHFISYVAETTVGTTPGTPTMREILITGANLNLQRPMMESALIQGDRMRRESRLGVHQVTGTVDFEMVYGRPFSDLLAGALWATWTSTTGATGSVTGGSTRQSFTFERGFTGLDTAQYLQFTGCFVNGFSLSISPEAILTGSFDIMGIAANAATSSSLGAATAATSYNPFDAFTGTIKEGATLATISVITSVDLNLTNNINPSYVVGQNTAADLVGGRRTINGTVNAFFQNATLYNKFVNETTSALQIILEDPETGGANGNKYQIDLPNVKYTASDIPVSDEGPVIMSMPFEAFYDSTTGYDIKITRTDSA